MIESKVIKTTFCMSFIGHCLLFGVPGLKVPSNPPQEEEVVIDFKFEKLPLLPDIKQLADEKMLQNEEAKKEIPEAKALAEKKTTHREKEEVDVKKQMKDNLFRYKDTVNRQIQENIVYPDRAKIDGIEGIAIVRFDILRDGRAINISLVTSSGSKLLDKEAINTVKRASPFMSVPRDLPGNSVLIDATLVFQLYRGND